MGRSQKRITEELGAESVLYYQCVYMHSSNQLTQRHNGSLVVREPDYMNQAS